MFSRNIRSIGLAVTVLLAASAGARAQNECGTVLSPDDVKVIRYLQSIGAYEPPAVAPDYVPQIPVTLHVVRRSNGTGNITAAGADAQLALANTAWQVMGVQFFRPAAVNFIDDDGLFNIDDQIELGLLWLRDVRPNTVNIYFVNTIWNACGYGSFPISPSQGIAIATLNNGIGCTPAEGNVTTLAHELGHYFDLLHTHETATGEECPDGSNCASTGDLVCDTPADPGLSNSNMNSTCAYTGTTTRCNGQTFNPQTSNIMSSAAPRSCRNNFTGGQLRRVLAALDGPRANLVDAGSPGVVWVDFDAGSIFPDGGFGNPYTTLAEGIAHVALGGRVVIKGGSTNETGVFIRACQIDSFSGTAVIGN